MRRPLAAAAATLAAALTLGLAGCVTNDEGGHPDGWEPVTPDAVPELADRVPEDIRARGTISIGTNPPFAPLEFKDAQGEIIGFDLDLARAAAEVLDLDLVVREQDFTLILPSISAGTV